MKKPLFALTMGDPSGIGPEISLKALSSVQAPNIMVIGDFSVIKNTADSLGIHPEYNVIKSPEEFISGRINILDMEIVQPDQFTIGTINMLCGKAAFSYINTAIDLALEKKIDGIITNPINKESLQLAGVNYPGHTEIFAARTGVTDFAMMFLLEKVCVAHVTTHCSLRQAIDLITSDRIVKKIALLNDALILLGFSNPRIAVGGLNPHAGEHGLFGTEEIDQIIPAVDRAIKLGITVSGPYPPDTVFMRAFRGEFDGVVAMLHDHGFVALKSRDFENGVNITIGLPIIRTSVGHGTAFDIAGKGIASPESLLRAIEAAEKMYYNKR
jgi:4-hydroxythreonine-4-phosphate dehydrogenase